MANGTDDGSDQNQGTPGVPDPSTVPQTSTSTDPGMMNQQQALQYIQSRIGRPLTSDQISQAYARFGGDPTSMHSAADLDPVVQYFQSQSAPQPPGPGQSATDIAAHPPSFNAPTYTPPPAFSYDAFKAPTGADALAQDPGYQFRLQQGQQALENNRAAMGVMGTGGTIKDFLNYGQQAASQEYGQAFDRAAQTYQMNRANALGNYMTNYQTQYTDPFNFAFQNAQATLQPQELAYTTQVGAAQHAADQAQLYDFNNRVFDWQSQFARDQFNYTQRHNAQTDAFDQWYRRNYLGLQAAQ